MNNTLPVRTILGILICYVIFHHILYFQFDGRLLPDHTFYFLMHFSRIAEAPEKGLLEFVWQIFNLSKQTMYPLVNALLAAAGYIFGANLTLFRLFNIPFYIIIILGSYALGRRLAEKYAGLACAFAVATLPIFDNFSRKFFPQFHSAAFLVWAFVLVVDLQAGNWKYWRGILLGVLIGLSWLSHPIGILMSIPILVFLVFNLLVFLRKNRRKHPTLFLVPLSALLITALTYSPIIAQFAGYYGRKKNYILPDAANFLIRTLPDNIFSWFVEIYQYHLGGAYTIAGLIGLVCLCMAIIISDHCCPKQS